MFDYIYVLFWFHNMIINMKHPETLTKFTKRPACPLYLEGQFEMDPLLGCWSRYLGTGAQDVAGRLGGATDQRQRRVFAVLSGVFHRSYDAFQQADPKTSGTSPLNIKGGICGDFAFVLGRGYHKPVFLMDIWIFFRHLLLRVVVLRRFFWRHLKDSVDKNGLFYSQNQRRQTRQQLTWHDSTRPIGLVEPGTSSLWTNCMVWPVALSVPRAKPGDGF